MLLLKTLREKYVHGSQRSLGEKYVQGPERSLSYSILPVFLLSLLMVEREGSSKTPFGGPLSTFLKPVSIASSEQHHIMTRFQHLISFHCHCHFLFFFLFLIFFFRDRVSL